MGKDDGKTDPKLKRKLLNMFLPKTLGPDSPPYEVLSRIPYMGEHVFIVTDMPVMAKVVVMKKKLWVDIPSKTIEMVCRVKIVSFFLKVGGKDSLLGIIDFPETDKLSVYNGTIIFIKLRNILKNPETKMIWIEERDGPNPPFKIRRQRLLK